jgi:hypothetical protein
MTGWFPKSANATERHIETGRLTMNIVEAGSGPAVLSHPKGMEEIAALIPGAEYRLNPGLGTYDPCGTIRAAGRTARQIPSNASSLTRRAHT